MLPISLQNAPNIIEFICCGLMTFTNPAAYSSADFNPSDVRFEARGYLCPRDVSVCAGHKFNIILWHDLAPYRDQCIIIFLEIVYVRKKLKSVALVGEQTMPTERPPLVGEVSANILRIECVAWSAQRIPTVVNFGFLDRSRYFFLSSSSSVVLTRLSGPRSRPAASQKICQSG
jgi:hypothetical protein